MKIARNALYIFAYICQYLMPIILFGFVVPYYRGTAATGATGAGIIALCLVFAITYRKIERKIDENVSGAWHGILLSIVPIIIWISLGIGIHRVLEFVETLVAYWWVAFIFIIIGRLLTTVGDAMEA